MCSTLPYLQLGYSTFTCVPLYLIFNWSIIHLHVYHFILSATGVYNIYMCTNLPYLQLEHSTFSCVPLYLIRSINGVYYLYMSSTLLYLQLEYKTFTCVPLYLIYNWSIVHLHVFHFTLSTTGV